jgi:alkanesulfonate monooxygenase SsuD/methylene tetrahydromethanopterin reductase-like flavin-dependent oxidoreductase (luciferase family)
VSAITTIGLGISTSAAGDERPLAQALQAEALGFDFVSASDHPVGEQPNYEAFALLTWIAARTDRIGIATRVIGVIRPVPLSPIPIWLGTYGPRALTVTGRLADGWIPSFGFASPEQIPAMLDRIRDASEQAGRDRDAVRAIYNVAVDVGARSSRRDGVVVGAAAEVVGRLREFTHLGFTGFNLIAAPDQMAVIANEVLPALRR